MVYPNPIKDNYIHIKGVLEMDNQHKKIFETYDKLMKLKEKLLNE